MDGYEIFGEYPFEKWLLLLILPFVGKTLECNESPERKEKANRWKIVTCGSFLSREDNAVKASWSLLLTRNHHTGTQTHFGK